MKNQLLWIVWVICLWLPTRTQAQDSARVKSKTGLRVMGDIGLLKNNSLAAIRQQLQQTGLDASGVGDHFSTFVLSFVRDYPKTYSEFRLLLVNSDNIDPTNSPIDKRVTFYGYGFGGSYTFKLINSQRFVVGPTVGYDFMWYRLRILPQNSQNLSITNIVANPAYYNTIKLRQGFYTNIQAAFGAEYKTGWFKKLYDDFRIGVRVGYQLPLIRNDKWRYTDGVVGDVPGFKSNMLFSQIGFTFINKSKNNRSR